MPHERLLYVRDQIVPVSHLPQHGLDSDSFAWLRVISPAELYTVRELAVISSLSTDTIRRLFIDEEGVLVIASKRRRTRLHRTLRIPGVIALGVSYRLTNKSGE